MPSKAIPAELKQRHDDFDEWVRTVRNPATYNSEGPRVIKIGSCRFEYQLAPLPDGRYAARSDRQTDNSGGGSPWKAFPSRAEALEHVLTEARKSYDMSNSGGCVTNTDLVSGPKMLERLSNNSLFGFEEPDPLPREEWYPAMITWQIGSMMRSQNFDIVDIVRGGNYKPISKSGSFFDIPLPPGVKDTWNDDCDEEGECEDDDD
jgi:hypothetical protein